MGVGSLPVRLGVASAARAACWIMALPQVAVMLCLIVWGRPAYAFGIGALLVAQLLLMDYFTDAPTPRALFYSGFGVPLFVSGMMVSAFALRSLAEAAT
jgi:chlorophyll synthase